MPLVVSALPPVRPIVPVAFVLLWAIVFSAARPRRRRSPLGGPCPTLACRLFSHGSCAAPSTNSGLKVGQAAPAVPTGLTRHPALGATTVHPHLSFSGSTHTGCWHLCPARHGSLTIAKTFGSVPGAPRSLAAVRACGWSLWPAATAAGFVTPPPRMCAVWPTVFLELRPSELCPLCSGSRRPQSSLGCL